MPMTTEVLDRDSNGALAVSLAELLALLSAQLGPVDWHLLELDAVSADWGDTDLDELNGRIEQSPAGLPLDPEELFHIAGELQQVNDALLCVPAHGATLRKPVDENFHRNCRIALRCVAGGRWAITTDDTEVHEMLRSTFKQVVAVS